MKLEVGMYYRYKGIIGKYYKPDLGKAYFTNQHKYTWNEIANGGKFSHNIIDLIQVGDYVNGYKVISLWKDKTKVIGVAVDGSVIGFDENEIKSVLTKEQFESMSYKVGE